MYERIGKKIKTLVKIVFVLLCIPVVIFGFSMINVFENLLGMETWLAVCIGLVTVVVGIFLAWVSTLIIYGFGEIIDKLCDIEINTRNPRISSAASGATASRFCNVCGAEADGDEKFCHRCGSPVGANTASTAAPRTEAENERISRLDKLLSQGLITEEDYKKAMSKKKN